MTETRYVHGGRITCFIVLTTSYPPSSALSEQRHELIEFAIEGDVFRFTIALFVLILFMVFRGHVEKHNLMVLLRNTRLS